MNPTNRKATHPGEILWEEFLLQHPNINGDIDKLAEYLAVVYGTTKAFWLGLYEAWAEPASGN